MALDNVLAGIQAAMQPPGDTPAIQPMPRQSIGGSVIQALAATHQPTEPYDPAVTSGSKVANARGGA